MAQIIDGRALAEKTQNDLLERVASLVQRGVRPGLAVVQVGDNAASTVYVRNKVRACEAVRLFSEKIHLPVETSQAELLSIIDRLNKCSDIHGILIQLPLPSHISGPEILEAIDPAKDVDGFHPDNLGYLLSGNPRLVPCTPLGIMRMFEAEKIPLRGARAVMIGASNIVGKPMFHLLLAAGATVTVCNSKTRDLATHTREADVLIVAVGRPKMVTGDMVKPGACVIDVGINRLESGKLVGDVDFESAKAVAGHITPVPGGVGPMTIAMLVSNTVDAAYRQIEQQAIN